MSRIRLQNKMERTSVESLGYYEYDNKERLGFGAFAIVFKGWVRNVSISVNLHFITQSFIYVFTHA